MNLYEFIDNGNKINEEIKMTHISNTDVEYCMIGNIYNLVDYINYSISGPAKIKLVNFTGNKLDFIIKAITKYKTIVSNGEYYSLIINDKKRIRGR